MPGEDRDVQPARAPTRRVLLSSGGLFVAGAAIGASASAEPRPPPAASTGADLAPNGIDDTEALQAALDAHAEVRLAAGHFAIRSVKLRSGNRLTMTPATVLHARPLRDGELPSVLLLDGVDDVVVSGGLIDGTNGPVTLGVGIYGARRVRILGTRVVGIATDEGVKGDGFYIARSSAREAKRMAEDIVLDGVTADANGRQGLSVIAVRGLRVTNSSFTNTTSAAPGAGIDFEPNKDADTIEDVVIAGCAFMANEVGILFYMKDQERLDDVTITDCSFRDNRTSGIHGDMRNCDNVTVSRCSFRGNHEHGLLLAHARSIAVVDCTIRDHRGGSGIEIDDVAQSIVRGNSVRGSGQAGIVIGATAAGPACRALIQGNHLWDNGGEASRAAIRVVSHGPPAEVIATGNWFGATPGNPAQAIGVRTEGAEARAHLDGNQTAGHPLTPE